MNQDSDFIYKKIVSLSKTKKFLGVTPAQVVTLCKKLPGKTVESCLDRLVDEKMLSKRSGRVFPAEWKPQYSRMEQDIVDFISPCFTQLISLRPGKVLSEFTLFNETSFENLLLKMELEGKIIKLEKLRYIDKSLYNSSLETCKDLSPFSIKDFCSKTNFKRDNAFLLLKHFETSHLVRFNGKEWIFL